MGAVLFLPASLKTPIIMNLPTNNATISSVEIAAIAGALHKNVMRDIRAMEPSWEKIAGLKFEPANYIDAQGKSRPCFQLTKSECLYVATKFNDEARAKLVLRWEALEHQARVEFEAYARRVESLESSMVALKGAVYSEPVNGVWPIIKDGVVGYPRKELLVESGYSYRSGNVQRLKDRYGQEHFFQIYRTACVSFKMAGIIKQRGKDHQLKLNIGGHLS